MAPQPAASPANAPPVDRTAPLLQTLHHAEPLNSPSISPLVGTEPGMIHPDVWAVLDDLAEGMRLTDAAALIDRPMTWLRDNTRNQAVKRELAKRVAHIGNLRAIRAWKRIEELADQSESLPTAIRAAVHLTQSEHNGATSKRGLSDTQRGKSVVVVLNRRNRTQVGTVLDVGNEAESFSVHVSQGRGRTRVSVSDAGADDDGSDVIEGEAVEIETPRVTPALVRAAVRAGIDAGSFGDGLDDADPDDQ